MSAPSEHVRFRAQREDDGDEVFSLVQAAFGRSGMSVARLEAALAERTGLAIVAESGDAILGQVRLTEGWIDAPTALVPVWVLSPLSVLPEYQGKGVGSSLVRAALGAAAESDRPLVFLEGAPSFYARVGFERASLLGFVPPSVRIPDVAFQVARVAGYEPWMTGALIYSDTFWRHDSVGLR